ncbi:AbrB/MazE/SpoVT family DNA-binding domain-containing protein [Gottschalkia acidurici]|nr:AbrB/MazE/SpoVT family DNA-binding domain-containing protein [Gottschalkia acidurici]
MRKADELERVVIPKELRNTLEILVGTPLEIYVDGK